jgi:hypothetical protein
VGGAQLTDRHAPQPVDLRQDGRAQDAFRLALSDMFVLDPTQ